MSDERRTMTAPEAERELGVPASSIRGWASLQKLFAVGIDQRGRKLYRVSDVLALREATGRRARHTRPTRGALRQVDPVL